MGDFVDKCRHTNTIKKKLVGGEGPDDAAELIKCADCAAYRWKYCDGELGSWRAK